MSRVISLEVVLFHINDNSMIIFLFFSVKLCSVAHH